MQYSVDESLAADHHAVHFYDDVSELTGLVGSCAASALLGGEAALIIATREHQDHISAWLGERGIDVELARTSQQLTQVDALATLGEFMEDGLPEPDRFDSAVGGLLRRASGAGEVWAFGEMVALLWEAGNLQGALQLERLWNDVPKRVPLRLLCGYPNWVTSDPGAAGVLGEVCACHGRVTGVAPSDEEAERTAAFSLGADSARSARRFVASVLNEWELCDLIHDSSLVVTELAANAMAHGHSDFTVGLSRAPTGVKVSVGDAGTGTARLVDPGPDASSGRGLGLVAALAEGWGQVRSPIGKLVWALLASPAKVPRAG